MRNMLWLLAIVIIISMAYPGAGNAESFIKVRGLGWDSAISGKIRADEGLLAGSSIDLNDTLGITDSTVVPEIEGKIGFLGTSRFIIAYSPASYEGRKRSYQQLNFGGRHSSAAARCSIPNWILVWRLCYMNLRRFPKALLSPLLLANRRWGFCLA